ncbi:MAG: hypothetical protein ABIU05_17250 [Nitrospirales bacterium]
MTQCLTRMFAETKKGRWGVIQPQWSMLDVRCSITCATGFAQLFEQLHPEHAEALRQFQKKIQQSCRDLGDALYKNKPQDGHDGTDTP